MKRILLSLSMLVFVGALAAGATGAYFSDAQTSSGNVFTAGAIDLTVDSTQHYNGNTCVNGVWTGTSTFPVPGSACDGTWTATKLGPTNKFFNFPDVKPGDNGEDTISLHINNNDAWACMDVTATNNAENGTSTPEVAAGDSATLNGQFDGELAQNLSVFAWRDDGSSTSVSAGDNIFEPALGEKLLFGPEFMTDLFGGTITASTTTTIPLADSTTGSGPLLGGADSHIGWAWCVGTTSLNTTTGAVTCSGAGVDNKSQTDQFMADVTLRVTQARNQSNFVCAPQRQCTFDSTTNHVVNGGFETPIVTNAAKWDIFPSGTAGLGWTVAWRSDIPATFGSQTRPAIANIEFHRGVLGPAFEGQQYAELDSDWGGPSDSGQGEPASVVISQTIATIPGATYKIHFQFAPRPNTTADENVLGITWGGVAQTNVGPLAGGAGNPVWAPHDYSVTATTTSTVLSFTDLGTADSLGTFLDDVQVTQTSCVNTQ